MTPDDRLWFLETLDRLHQAMATSDELEEVLPLVLQCFDGALLVYPFDPLAASYTCYTSAGSEPAPDDPNLRDRLRRVLCFEEGPAPLDEGLALAIGNYALFTTWTTPLQQALLEAARPRLEKALQRLETIRRQRRHLEQVQQVGRLGYWEYDVEADRVHWTGATAQILGLAPDHPASLPDYQQRIHPEDRARQRTAFAAALQGLAPYSTDYRIVRPDGEVRSLHSEAHVTRAPSGRPLRVFGVLEDVTERRRAEDELRLFRTLVDHTNDGVQVIDPETGRFLDVNHQACVVHGCTREEYLRLSVRDVDPLVAQHPWLDVVGRLGLSGRSVFETVHRRKDGTTFPVEVSSTFIQLERPYLLAVVRDITERQQAHDALRESHSLLKSVLEGTSDVIFVKDLQGRYLLLNNAGLAFLDRDLTEVLGRNDLALFPPAVGRAIMDRDRQVMDSGGSLSYEQVIHCPGGATRTFLSTMGPHRDGSGAVVGLLGMARDVTESKRLEEQLRQSQKVEAIGQLAGGIAHDFNNLLTVINSYADLLLQKGDGDRKMLGAIHEAGTKAASLTGRLLAFSRKQLLQPTVVDFNELLPRLVDLLRRVIGEHIELRLIPGPSLARVCVDVGQFEQSVLNLAVNARDAMTQGGCLTIETSNRGEFVEVSLTDTGHGIDEPTRAHLFEPFFTTKQPGHGTGLGLAMVYGFVKQSGGCLEVESEPGKGATFRIHLPRAETPGPTRAVSGPSHLPAGTETILLVEDDTAVRRLTRKVLQSCGYRVLEAAGGELALGVARQHPEPIDLVVTDLVMPRMSGRQFADLLGQERPGLPFLFMSGYPRGQTVEPADAFLQKPFGPTELARTVRDLLDRTVA